MGISAISLFENNRSIENLTVYLLGERISNENKKILSQIGRKYERTIVVIDVPKLNIPEILVSARWPVSAFTRLYSGQLLPKSVHKVLYLDCDTIVRGNIAELLLFDLETAMCGGVKDCIGKTYKENIGLYSDEEYINAGVILFNVEEMRKIDIGNVIDTYMKKYLRFINYADQDILNMIFKGKIKVLPPQFNMMTITSVYSYEDIIRLRRPTNYYCKEDIITAVKNPIIIHYTTNMRTVRPWFSNATHPYTSLFHTYMDISPWVNRKMQHMIFTSKESKIIGVLIKLPKKVALNLLGTIHSELRPRYIRIVGKKRII